MCAGTHMLMEQSTEIREGEFGSGEHASAGAMPLSSGGGPVLRGGWPGSRVSTGGRKAGRLGGCGAREKQKFCSDYFHFLSNQVTN